MHWLKWMALVTALLIWLKHGGYSDWVPVLLFTMLGWIASDFRRVDSAPRWIDRVFPFAPTLLWLLFIGSDRLRYVTPPGSDWPIRLLGLLALGASVIVGRELRAKREAPGRMAWNTVIAALVLGAIIAWVPSLSPDPFIDVFRSNRLALEHFLSGRNVYAEAYPDIYGGRYDYAPGFLYWPGTLLALVPGHALLGDLRYSLGACLAITVAAVAWFLRGERRIAPDSYLWTMYWLAIPIVPFVIEQAWIDPILAAQSVVALLAARRGNWLISAMATGFMLATKQYGFLLPLFLLPFLWREWGVRRAAIWTVVSGAVFLAILIPFVLPDPQAFWNMTVSGHASAGVRLDALNFTALLARLSGFKLPGSVQALASVAGIAIGLNGVLRAKRGEWHRVPWAMAQAFIVSFLFGKFAFGNYYFLSLTWVALGAILHAQERITQEAAATEALAPLRG